MCENRVSYWLTRGNGMSKEYFVRCGNTDPYGRRAICEECSSAPAKMAEINRLERLVEEDNETSRAAGWGDW